MPLLDHFSCMQDITIYTTPTTHYIPLCPSLWHPFLLLKTAALVFFFLGWSQSTFVAVTEWPLFGSCCPITFRAFPKNFLHTCLLLLNCLPVNITHLNFGGYRIGGRAWFQLSKGLPDGIVGWNGCHLLILSKLRCYLWKQNFSPMCIVTNFQWLQCHCGNKTLITFHSWQIQVNRHCKA